MRKHKDPARRRNRQKYSQVERCLRVIRLLSTRKSGITVYEIMEITGATKRTIYRDMDMIALAGFPIKRVKKSGVYPYHWSICDRDDPARYISKHYTGDIRTSLTELLDYQ